MTTKKDIYEINEIIEKIEIENQRKREEKEGEIIEIEEIIERNNQRIGEILDRVERMAEGDEEAGEKIEWEVKKVEEIETRIKEAEKILQKMKQDREIVMTETFHELKRMI